MKKTYILTVCTLSFLLTGIYGQCEERSFTKVGMTPADKSMYGPKGTVPMDEIDDADDMDDSSTAKKKGYSYSDENMVYKSLSPKSQKAFKTLSREDKQKVIDAYKNGNDPVRTIGSILQDDKKNAKPMTNGKGSSSQMDDDDDMDDGDDTGSYRSRGDCDMGCQLEESPAVKTMRKKQTVKKTCENDNIFY